MATKPISKYTVQESNNLQVYENYSCTTMAVNDFDADGGVNVEESANYITSGLGPAKRIVIFAPSGNAGDEIKVYLKVNGAYGDAITVQYGDFPLSFEGVLVEQIKISSDDTGLAGELFFITLFH